MSKKNTFSDEFAQITGNPPFPWQIELFECFLREVIPSSCDLPTGLGKTSLIAVWLIALASKPAAVPRRLVYVVNRRTVVDQTTSEVEKYGDAAGNLDPTSQLKSLIDSLRISTLRGQFADNRKWSADPSKPAVISGTVDMIGSRLLFGGYRIGFKSRPLHAGFLSQDVLLVHDEAHLEPAFQELVERIQTEQHACEYTGELPWPKLRVMALSATTRNARNDATDHRGSFVLTTDERDPPEMIPDPPTEPIHHVWRRLKAVKRLYLHRSNDEKKLVDQLVRRALVHKSPDSAVLIFARSVENATAIANNLTTELKNAKLPQHVTTLTGTMRGHERDKLVRSDFVFARFMPASDRSADVALAKGTSYLVCTSAGEVGVNLSADHLVCDLSTFDSMVQRLGRVNRFGDRNDTRVDVLYPAKLPSEQDIEEETKKNRDERKASVLVDGARRRTLDLLNQLVGDASPLALNKLDPQQRAAAFAPEPKILPATEILFDAWAMTTIRDKMPGRPPVAPYLHGVAQWEPPRTSVAWRAEVELITDELLDRHGPEFPRDLLEDYPLKPHELLNDATSRVFSALQRVASKHLEAAAWVIDTEGQIKPRKLSSIADPNATKAAQKRRLEAALAECTVLLPPSVGGLSRHGMLVGRADYDPARESWYDIADEWYEDKDRKVQRRVRKWTGDDDEVPSGMALVRTIDTNPWVDESAPAAEDRGINNDLLPDDVAEPDADDSVTKIRRATRRFWHWYVRPRSIDENATLASMVPVTWDHHTDDVVTRATELVEALGLPKDLKRAVVLAAEFHDLGKKRELWQRSIGNPEPTNWYAKPGKPLDGPRWQPRRLSEYRHEFGTLLDVLDGRQSNLAQLRGLRSDMQDVVLHLIAAHHGYARPHFPVEATVDPNQGQATAEAVAKDVIRRYARLQRKYGRWGLAYLESLLRAADWAASAEPSKLPDALSQRQEVYT